MPLSPEAYAVQAMRHLPILLLAALPTCGGEAVSLAHLDGQPAFDGQLRGGFLKGAWKRWHPSGMPAFAGTFRQGELDGT